MSYVRLNITDQSETISDDVHGFFGDAVVAALTAEPETIAELAQALVRFIKSATDASLFSRFRCGEKFEPYDAGIVIVDLAARLVAVDSTYSRPSKEFSIRVQSDFVKEDFNVPIKLSDDWLFVHSIPEYEGVRNLRRQHRLESPPLDARRVLFGRTLSEFLISECEDVRHSDEKGLFRNIHIKWLTTARDDLRGKTPREILLDKRSFIDFDLESRALQWSFTKEIPPPLPSEAHAYRFSSFGTHELVVYYDFFRYLLGQCLDAVRAGSPQSIEQLSQIKNDWLRRESEEFDGRTPGFIIEMERRRLNMPVSAHEAMIDEDCEICQAMAEDFDTPIIWHLDGCNMDEDFEFSFYKTREEYDEEERQREEFSREFDRKWNAGKFDRLLDDAQAELDGEIRS